MHLSKTLFAISILGFFLSATVALAQPKPGDVYREYRWNPSSARGPAATQKWLRVTGPNATDSGAKAFLPNSVNRLQIDDFEHATRAEMSLEVLNVHPGTRGHKVRLNGGDWLPIPLSPLIGSLEYHSMQYPVVPVSLDSLKEGLNTFEFTAKRGSSFAGQWPQWLSYGASVRIYYDETAKDHPTGQITSHGIGASVEENDVFSATATSTKPIKQVEFVGKYTDFNWKGDGNYRQWQDQTAYAKIRNHIGTDTQAPFNVTWDNDWVPDQDEPMEVSARIVDESGLTYITPSVTGLEFDRPYSVDMHKPHDVPRKWGTRADRTHTAKINVGDDLSDASAARITLATWNGVASDAIRLNDDFLTRNVGKNHDLSYNSINVPLESVQRGTNSFSTFSDTVHHGIDVQWPGPVLFVRNEIVPEPSTLVLLGLALSSLFGCRRSRSNFNFDTPNFTPQR